MNRFLQISKISIILAITNGIIFGISYFAIDLINSTFIIALIISICFISVVLANNYIIRILIGKKITNIYQLLNIENNTLKTPIILKKKTISEIEREVEDWIESKSIEIRQLKEMELYRKEFLGNVSHELKTPIFIAQSYIETLLDGSLYDENVNRKHLKKSLKSILRLSDIVNDLELISKLEKNTLNLKKKAFNLNVLIKEVVDSLEIQSKKEKIDIIIEIPPKSICKVFADKEKIEQVIYNLLVNGIKYNKEHKGFIKIRCKLIENNYLLEIEDNGIGIKDTELNRIFERFYRVDKNRSRKKGGTGLGLSIVKHILEAHGQSIYVESKLGEGTKFSFLINRHV